MKKPLVSLVMAGLFLTGCFHIKYVTNSAPLVEPSDDSLHHEIVLGLVEISDPVDAAKICPQGVSVVQNTQTFVDGLIKSITFNIYSPLSITTYCKAANNAPAR